MNCLVATAEAATAEACAAACARRVPATCVDRGDAGASASRNFLNTLEVDLRAPEVEQRAELGILRIPQVALRLHDEEVRREPDVEAALFGLEALFGELASGNGRLQACTIGDAIFDAGNQSRRCANSNWASRPTKNGGAA